MDDVTVFSEGGLLAVLTCNSSASSYGVPILRLTGHGEHLGDFGPGDFLDLPGHNAGEWVRTWAAQPDRTDLEREAARRFGA